MCSILIFRYVVHNKNFNLPVCIKAIPTWLNLVTLSKLNLVEMSYVILKINTNSFALPEKNK